MKHARDNGVRNAGRRAFALSLLEQAHKTRTKIGFPVMTPLTAVLLGWKRPDNLRRVVQALSRQTVRPRLFLWNNGEPFSDPRIDWQVDSSVNRLCWPRWFVASLAETEYVCVHDDDLLLGDERVLQDTIRFLQDKPEDVCVGPFGVVLQTGTPYRRCRMVVPAAERDQPVDVVKGRLMVLRTVALERVALVAGGPRHVGVGDDIAVCGRLAGGRRGHHCVPSLFHGRTTDLPEPHGLSYRPEHYALREQSRRAFFG